MARKFAGKNHPLSKANFFSNLLFFWIRPFLNFTQKVSFKQEHHYKLPEHDKVQTHKARVKKGLEDKKTIVGMIFSQYKWKLVEFSLVGIFSAILSLVSGSILRQTSYILKDGVLNDIKVI